MPVSSKLTTLYSVTLGWNSRKHISALPAGSLSVFANQALEGTEGMRNLVLSVCFLWAAYYLLSLYLLPHTTASSDGQGQFLPGVAAEFSFQFFHHLQSRPFVTCSASWDSKISRPAPFLSTPTQRMTWVPASWWPSCETRDTSIIAKQNAFPKGLSFRSEESSLCVSKFLMIPSSPIWSSSSKYESCFLQLLRFWYLSGLLLTCHSFS